ncbi:cytochrome oxidase [Sphingopyxis sp. H038]|uniref:bile acid:sodium symporter family protein n=1 Tax=unclassified Sphingopyxis TaxID=2614943 RepID=UPI000731BA22|nr:MULTISPECIES: bile acid:sodium symporter family protein [unclassified Sphingopyxis]KTE02601.1 cytochrome oxidase [Sphingopyxis sp. H012]KTE11162.1 cytochrome oxidase [Sphingopyxis sp. H053]KTE12240.1 cytochrome oxidase [Sphingopyxis sp. H093]KTE30644.1 cytochrome oxidase [Sphingopyxis sp. H080]KTE35650.1 cytochrome oxidase [Sphingopyxis sp. H038]
MLSRIFPDRFVPVLFATILLASLLPVRGAAVPIAGGLSTAAIIFLFFLNGVRLPREEVLHGIRNWKLQGSALAFCFGFMALLGLAAQAATAPLLPATLALGFLFLGILPSTVQSATAASSLAGGNVAASVVAAALLNLSGVALSPLLFALLAGSEGEIHGQAVLRIVSILLIPFVAGQLVQRWLRPWVLAHRGLATFMDRTAIAIAVYVAFSAAVVAGIWSLLDGREIAIVFAAVAALLALSFGGAWALGGLLKLARPDRITLLFSGAQKSIAVGAPLAATLFPPAIAGMVLVPILVYHMAQLILSAWIAPVLRSRQGVVLE